MHKVYPRAHLGKHASFLASNTKTAKSGALASRPTQQANRM